MKSQLEEQYHGLESMTGSRLLNDRACTWTVRQIIGSHKFYLYENHKQHSQSSETQHVKDHCLKKLEIRNLNCCRSIAQVPVILSGKHIIMFMYITYRISSISPNNLISPYPQNSKAMISAESSNNTQSEQLEE